MAQSFINQLQQSANKFNNDLNQKLDLILKGIEMIQADISQLKAK